ncbi:unnamed protein product [Discosporangium mesarthrocarpum]
MPGIGLADVWEYTSAHLRNLRDLEERYAADPTYMEGQNSIVPACRAVLVDWMVDLCTESTLRWKTFHMAVNYLDRFLSIVEDWSLHRLQLLGVAALLVASKVEEIYPPTVRELSASTDHCCSPEEIMTMEVTIITQLAWRLNPPTPCEVIALLLEKMVALSTMPKPGCRIQPDSAAFGSPTGHNTPIPSNPGRGLVRQRQGGSENSPPLKGRSHAPALETQTGSSDLSETQANQLGRGRGSSQERVSKWAGAGAGAGEDCTSGRALASSPILTPPMDEALASAEEAAHIDVVALLADHSSRLQLLGRALELASYTALDMESLHFSPTEISVAAITVACPPCLELAHHASGTNAPQAVSCTKYLAHRLQAGDLAAQGNGEGVQGERYRRGVRETLPAWDWRAMAARNSQALEHLQRVRGWDCPHWPGQRREGRRHEGGESSKGRAGHTKVDSYGCGKGRGVGRGAEDTTAGVPQDGRAGALVRKTEEGDLERRAARKVLGESIITGETVGETSKHRTGGASTNVLGLLGPSTTGNKNNPYPWESIPDRLRPSLPQGVTVQHATTSGCTSEGVAGETLEAGECLMPSSTESDEVNENQAPEGGDKVPTSPTIGDDRV